MSGNVMILNGKVSNRIVSSISKDMSVSGEEENADKDYSAFTATYWNEYLFVFPFLFHINVGIEPLHLLKILS
jgi:hypothetical protein